MSWLGKLFKPAGSGVSTDALQTRQDAPPRAADTSARGEARKFLREMLATGSAPAEELLRRAREFDHAEKTVRRAKADLGIRAYRVGQAREQRWFWIFPEMANTHPAEIANGSADMATLAPVAISPSNGKTLVLDLPVAATQVVADERLGGTPDAGEVPGGFTIPPGAECVSWALKPAPMKLDRGVTVLNVDDLVKGHLEILAAKLRGDKGWLFEQWPLTTLLADLSDVGVELRVRERDTSLGNGKRSEVAAAEKD